MTEGNQLQFRNQWGPLVKIEMGREMPPGNAHDIGDLALN